jgi:hypothetical protein
MITESSESGRAGLVSGVLGIFAFPNGEAGGACGVGPTELDMGPIAEADFLFEGADNGTGILETKHWISALPLRLRGDKNPNNGLRWNFSTESKRSGERLPKAAHGVSRSESISE